MLPSVTPSVPTTATPETAGRPRVALWATWALVCSAALSVTAPGLARDPRPFGEHAHEIVGLIHQVWPLKVSDCAGDAVDLLVLSSRGAPPELEKRLTWMPCGSALVPGDPRVLERALPPETAVIDVAAVPGRDGPQLLLLSGQGLRIEALSGSEPPRNVPVSGGLPLPDRPWEISRVQVVDDWHGNGTLSALLPARHGAWLVDLVDFSIQSLEMPVYASYRTWMPRLPETVWKWMVQDVTWPTLARADDDGDGRLDLFALSRWEVVIYHAGEQGLPPEPSRRLRLTPFDAETERRHESTVNNYFARDIDADGQADLLLSTVGGGLSDGRSTTRVFLNPGTGISTSVPPSAERVLEGGFSAFSFVDIEGDGREEILETSLEFGVVQIVRFLLTRRAETTVRVLGLDPSAPNGTRTLFEDDFSFRLDFAEGSVSGLVPSLGDWNGDGLLDFYVNRGDDEITFRMGANEPGKPRFGRSVGRQPVPLSGGQSRVADLDGDGLDEIVSFDPRRPEAPLVVFENLGRLPGTRRDTDAPPLDAPASPSPAPPALETAVD